MSKITKEDGTIEYRNGKNQLHCEDGPAIIYSDGTRYWCQNNELHRIDGPAVVYSNGEKRWYQNNKLHRTDGPAIIYSSGTKQFWINGEKLSKEQFQSMKFRFIKLCRK